MWKVPRRGVENGLGVGFALGLGDRGLGIGAFCGLGR